MMKRLLILLIAAAGSTAAWAQDAQVDNVAAGRLETGDDGVTQHRARRPAVSRKQNGTAGTSHRLAKGGREGGCDHWGEAIADDAADAGNADDQVSHPFSLNFSSSGADEDETRLHGRAIGRIPTVPHNL